MLRNPFELEKFMQKRMLRFALPCLIVVAAVGWGAVVGLAQSSSEPAEMPVFEVDPSWPNLPNNWVMGVVSSVTVDRRDHVWILQRPGSVQDPLKARAAPPVLEFDADGKFVNAWGGAAQGYDWPVTEHFIVVDDKDMVWIGGSGITDDFLLKFTLQGKFVKEFFGKGRSKGNADTLAVNRPSDVSLYTKTNEVFVSDGYGNRRVIVFDADTGAFKRMWGAFGNPPDSAPPAGAPGGGGGGGQGGQGQAAAPFPTEGPGSQQFGNPVHALKISNDGLVYVADRANRRVQVFTLDGKYVTQVFINRAMPSQGTAAGVAFSPDAQQQFLYVSDLGNSHMVVLNRKTLQVLYQFGAKGSKPGEFQTPHLLSVDSKGNLYTAEVAPGNRAQKFLFKGMSRTPPPNALTPAQLSATQ
jgi:DNA-binding beta-propeller fold protein YncE